ARTGEQWTREAHGADRRACECRADERLRLTVEERQSEPRVVRDEHGIPGEAEKTAHCRFGARGTPQLGVAQSGQRRDRRADRHARVDERLELLGELELADANRPDLADAGDAGT